MKQLFIGYIHRFIFIFTLVVLNVQHITAQNVKDSILMEQSKMNAINQFKNALNENALIYSGNEYVENVSLESMHQIIIGTPFFIVDSLINGIINYEGIEYHLPVKFNLSQQKLILKHPTYNTLIELYNERVNHFSIGQHYFYKTPTDLSSLMNSNQVYSERLLNGKIALWVMHDKKLKPTKKAEDQTLAYVLYDQFAVVQNGKWSKLKSEEDILDLCDDKKNKVKAYINNAGLDFKTNFELSALQALKYYNSIAD